MTYEDPQISLLTEESILLRFSHDSDPVLQNRLWCLAQALRRSDYNKSLLDIVPGPGNLMVQLRPDSTLGLSGATALLEQLWQETVPDATESRVIEIPVSYGGRHGPDLAAVARHCGISTDQVITLHSSATYQVICIGFQPGFPYLGGLDPRLATPRRRTPRTRIPAGSVAIGANQTGIYPGDSPGGWQIIGHTTIKLFDPETAPHCLLHAGDSVRFVPERADD